MSRVLFISARCDHSKKILIGIKQTPFLGELFEIVNIDTTPFPNYIQSVPSISISGRVIPRDTVFEYFGKLVEGKKAQDMREQTNQLEKKDEGVCRINEDGELEGYCGSSGADFSMITEENDDYTKKTYINHTNYDYLDGDDSTIHQQVKHMEKCDNHIDSKRQQFDSELERLQRSRGEMMQGNPMQGNPMQGNRIM